jgi:hypothetical protein
MVYTWKCARCCIAVEHLSLSTDPYLAGFEIHTEHKRRSPSCINVALEIFPGNAETLMNSAGFRTELGRAEAIGGIVEINRNTVTLYRGVMPQSTIVIFGVRLKKLDPLYLLNIVVSTKDRP